MRKARKKFSRKKLVLLLALLIFLFSLFKVARTLASTDSFTITSAEILSKSSTVEINSFQYEKYTIRSNVIFHNVGDSLTYKINIRNNEDVNYTVVSISDDNKNENVSYEYAECEGLELKSKQEAEFHITEKYIAENMDISKRNQDFSVNLYITLIDENGNESEGSIIIDGSSSPKTGDNIGIYITMAAASFVMLIILSKKKVSKHSGRHKKLYSMIIVGILIIPTVSKAMTVKKLPITFENEVSLQDKLIFKYEVDETVNEKIVKYNETVGNIETPNKEGYRFVGWEKSNGDLLDINVPLREDTSVKAKFEIIHYDIQYNLNGGEVESENPTTYTVEDEITLVNPTRLGYTFSGWTGSNGDELQTRVTINKGSTGEKTYTANYSPNQDTRYTVIHKLMNLDGQTYTTKDTEILHGATDTQVKPQTNVYTGFDAPDEKLITIGADGNTTLEYKYKRKKYKLTLVNAVDIETTTPTGDYYYETEITLKSKDKTGYTFKKWSTGETDRQITKIITEPLTIEAIYEANLYTISFDSKGGSTVDSIVRKYNEEIGTLPKPTKDGQIFVGWFDDESYTTQISSTTKVTGTKTYYAKWRNPENFEIRFNSKGGNDIPSKTIQEGSPLGELQTPEKENYKFRGWYTDNNYTTKVDENTIPTESTTYYAKWVDRLETVFSIENEVTFKGKNEAISDGEVPSEYLGNDGKYIDSHVALFSEANYDKDFEVGFDIVSYDPNNQDVSTNIQVTFVNTKNEDGTQGIKPGFVFRTYGKDKNKFELAAAITTNQTALFNNTVHNVKIYRQDKKLYYSVDGGPKTLVDLDFENYEGRFMTTTTFGASVQKNGTVYRHINGTLSNMYIKLEVDDYQED